VQPAEFLGREDVLSEIEVILLRVHQPEGKRRRSWLLLSSAQVFSDCNAVTTATL
jgi:hypothetical protein